MQFSPLPNFKLQIGAEIYRFAEHPSAKGMTYGQSGRRATVYQVIDLQNKKFALKVFHTSFRYREKLQTISAIKNYANLPGLKACNQVAIDPAKYSDVISKYPDLEFAILMPWIDGQTWQGIMLSRRKLSLVDCINVASSLANILGSMEKENIAQCNLSGSDVLITDKNIVEIVDFDDLYTPTLKAPIRYPTGSYGYAHLSQVRGSWEATADRFAGAILLVEMLTWHDERIKRDSKSEQYFDNRELQTDCDRYRLITQVLEEQGDLPLAKLFSKAWFSKTLDECPPLSEWVKYLQNRALNIGEVGLEIISSTDGEKKRPLLEAKLILLGQGSVGKTSLVERLLHSSFTPNQPKTEGIAVSQLVVEHTSQSRNIRIESQGKNIKLNVWDFGGQEIMHATHQFFLTKRSLYLLVIDTRSSEEQNQVEYWLKIIQLFSGESPVIIVGNKIDQHPLDIDQNGLQKKYPNIVGFAETSAVTSAGIDNLRQTIVEQVEFLPYLYDLIPEAWFSIKTVLENLRNESNFITYDRYLELCASKGLNDEISQRTLIGFLHDLGIVLHFQEDRHLAELGILNPQWVTNGVYKILNDKVLFANKGILTLALLDEILSAKEYPQNKRLFIVEMMRKFELCYDIDRNTFLVPDLLPKDEPAELKFNGFPAFEYAYPVLPSSVITRFIVRMNQKIDDGFVWRTGVVLKIGENKALVKADIEDRKITIAIDGVEYSRRDALSAIRYELGEIHNSIKGLNPQQRIPVPNAPLAEPLKYEYLLKLERAGQETVLVENGNDLVTVNVRQMLSAIESEEQRKTQGTVINNYYNANNGGIIVGRDLSGNLISGNYNKINSAEISSELKDTLLQLGEAVNTMIQKLPAEQATEVAEDFGKLADEAVKPKPNQKWYSVSIDGLIKAAENLDKLGEPVINLSRKVLSLLTGGVVK